MCSTGMVTVALEITIILGQGSRETFAWVAFVCLATWIY